ncbi:MAG: Asp-tRNA(Asn)/Glu-tRNA(Gln) amidotransferase subunit GatA [Candidatus Omnitrophica bacterium]|nr:Asp-tRNA(Asn)/Glu-tRNA(Gln) amidotransferase subunit GatA [Candidatus Omnitrophota bacterium]
MDSLLTSSELQERYRSRRTTPSEVTEELIRKIESLDPKLHAFAWFDPAFAREQAKGLEKGGISKGPLWGIPVLVKDNICVEGVPTTCASKILKGFRPPYDATAVEKLKKAGAILLGMANMDEFAFGSSCEYSCYGPTRNPWDPTRVPGGSSGGSAAAVAAGLTALALGSDTGGSIRQPAAFCGVVGMKPTYGRVSRYGLIAFASSLDQIGPIARTVEEIALLLQGIAGFDPRDSTSGNLPVPDYQKELEKPVKGLRLGVPKEYFVDGLDPEVKKGIDAALAEFRRLGMSVTEVSLPHTEYAIPTYYVIATAEASSNLARFDGVQYGHRSSQGKSLLEMYTQTREEGFGPEAKRRIILGTFVLSSGYYEAYYGRALKVRTLIKKDFDRVFGSVDCLVTPTSPTPAFPLGEKMEDPLTMYLSDIHTISVNLAGVPALSVPCGFTQGGLPIGMQLIAKPFAEETLLKAAYAYQQATGWHKRQPPS